MDPVDVGIERATRIAAADPADTEQVIAEVMAELFDGVQLHRPDDRRECLTRIGAVLWGGAIITQQVRQRADAARQKPVGRPGAAGRRQRRR